MRAVLYMYDIPTKRGSGEYPAPGMALRSFAVRIQYSCWVVPASHLHLCEPVTAEIQGIGGRVDVVPFDESDATAAKIRALALRSLSEDAERLREYVEASIKETVLRLEKAQAVFSVKEVNKAISFQATALSQAQHAIDAAMEAAIVFDLSGDLRELHNAVRKIIEERNTEFSAERKLARALAKQNEKAMAEAKAVVETVTPAAVTTPDPEVVVTE